VVLLSVTGIWLVCAGMTGYALRVMSGPVRAAFVLAGVLLLMPFQASSVNAWLNAIGGVLGIGLLAYELKSRRSHR
jgi:hypothetical protein